MNKIMIFNYCSIPIFLIILCTTFIRKTTKSLPNRLFILIICVSMFSVFVDLLADGYSGSLPLSSAQLAIVTIANYLYFITRNAIALLYLFFLFALTRTGFHRQSKAAKIALALPYLAVLLVLFTNPIHHKAFLVNADTGYERQPLLAVFYTASIFYSLWGCAHLIHCARILRTGKWLALMSMYLLSFTGILLQLFFPNFLIEIFATAVAFLLVVLLVLRPEEITDSNVGLPSWKAYCDEIFKIVKLRRPVQINVMRYINASQVRDYLGEQRFYDYIKCCVKTLEGYEHRAKIIVDLYYEAPGTFYFINTAPQNRPLDFNRIFSEATEEIRSATKDFEQFGVHLIPKMCIILYPDDIAREEEIIQLGHTFHDLMTEKEQIIRAADLVGTRRYNLETNITSILSRAITGSSFEMYYQPIVRLRDCRFCAAEALIRLNDSTFGKIPPSFFIPNAEKNGLIVSIGDFVIESVYRFISTHNMSELGLDYIEVNLSMAQIFQSDLLEKIHRLQQKYGVNPANINFEITETSYGDISNLASENIAQLVSEGYSFSLDDYGTGYSNMQRIVKLPLSLVKLDKSLIDEMENEDGKSVVRNTIKMMQDIKKHVLAEGVETKSQLDALTAMGCDYIQGFYFSRPLPEDEFVHFLTSKLQH